MLADPRLRQLSRIYQRPLETEDAARQAVAAQPAILASALFIEAAENDDVTSIEAALAYGEARLAELAPYTAGAADEVRRLLAEKLQTWASVT